MLLPGPSAAWAALQWGRKAQGRAGSLPRAVWRLLRCGTCTWERPGFRGGMLGVPDLGPALAPVSTRTLQKRSCAAPTSHRGLGRGRGQGCGDPALGLRRTPGSRHPPSRLCPAAVWEPGLERASRSPSTWTLLPSPAWRFARLQGPGERGGGRAGGRPHCWAA